MRAAFLPTPNAIVPGLDFSTVRGVPSWLRKGSKFWSECRYSCVPTAIRALGRCRKHGYNFPKEGMAMGSSAPIRILTVEDHPVFRTGLSTIIGSEQDMLLVAQAANAVEAITEFRRHQPDITLMDAPRRGTIVRLARTGNPGRPGRTEFAAYINHIEKRSGGSLQEGNGRVSIAWAYRDVFFCDRRRKGDASGCPRRNLSRWL